MFLRMMLKPYQPLLLHPLKLSVADAETENYAFPITIEMVYFISIPEESVFYTGVGL